MVSCNDTSVSKVSYHLRMNLFYGVFLVDYTPFTWLLIVTEALGELYHVLTQLII